MGAGRLPFFTRLIRWAGWFVGRIEEPCLGKIGIHPANVAMRAVELPPGEHVVVFRYSPWLTRLGAPIATFGLFLLFGWLCWPHRRR